MKILIYGIVSAASLSLLIACGGGGGNSTSPLTPNERQMLAQLQQAVGGQPLNLSPSQIRSELVRIRDASDRVFATDLLRKTLAGSGGRHTSSCAGNVCDVAGRRVDTSDFLNLEGVDLRPLMSLDGVSVASGSRQTPRGDGTRDGVFGFGGWLEYSVFVAEIDSLADSNNVAISADIYAFSLGKETGSNPVSGSATWTGAMAGIDTIDIVPIGGKATVRANFATARLDISFTDIHDENLNRHTDIHWNDVSLISGGFYAPGITAGNKIEGTFYGPHHSEVGGVFERSRYVGAFGARRQ